MREEIPATELERRPPQSTRRQKLLRLAAQGVNAKRAAELLGVSHQTILKEYKDREFRKQAFEMVEGAFKEVDEGFTTLQLSIHDRIRMKSEEAFEYLCQVLDDPAEDSRIRVKVATDLLDRNPETVAGTAVYKGEQIEAEHLAAAARVAEEMNKVIPIKRAV